MRFLSILSCALLLIILYDCSSGISRKELPAGMTEAFKQRYPEAQKIYWSRKDSSKFEVTFSFKNEHYSAMYASNAKWILTEKKISIRKLPATVVSTIKNGLGEYSVNSIKQVESDSLGNYYRVNFANGNKNFSINLSNDGVIMNFSDLKKIKD
jgi:hypothetical protein